MISGCHPMPALVETTRYECLVDYDFAGLPSSGSWCSALGDDSLLDLELAIPFAGSFIVDEELDMLIVDDDDDEIDSAPLMKASASFAIVRSDAAFGLPASLSIATIFEGKSVFALSSFPSSQCFVGEVTFTGLPASSSGFTVVAQEEESVVIDDFECECLLVDEKLDGLATSTSWITFALEVSLLPVETIETERIGSSLLREDLGSLPASSSWYTAVGDESFANLAVALAKLGCAALVKEPSEFLHEEGEDDATVVLAVDEFTMKASVTFDLLLQEDLEQLDLFGE